jgi:chromate reductase
VSLRVLGIPGSLRGGSYNRRLLEAARELAPDGIEVEVFDLAGIPLYDADLDTDEARPGAVERLKASIGRADAVLFATPEYNHSLPGVLKNAIDWASRPAGGSPLRGKPVAMMGASPGTIGTARAQLHLESVLLATLARPLPHPGVLVGGAKEKFDADGRLVHEATRLFLRRFLEELSAWTRRMGRPRHEAGAGEAARRDVGGERMERRGREPRRREPSADRPAEEPVRAGRG